LFKRCRIGAPSFRTVFKDTHHAHSQGTRERKRMGRILTLMTALFYSTFIGAATEPMRPLRSSRTTKRTVYSPSGCGEGFLFCRKRCFGDSEFRSVDFIFWCLLLWYYTVCNISPWEVGTLPDGIHPVVGIGISGVPPYGSVY